MQLNNIKIVNQLPSEVEFKPVESPISYRGRQYQLYEGEKRTPFAKRIAAFFKASLATIFTGFIGLCFESVRKNWGQVFHPTRTIKRYIPVIPSRETESLMRSAAVHLGQTPSVMPEAFPHLQKKEHRHQDVTATSILTKDFPSVEEIVIAKGSPKNEFDKILETIQKDAQRDLFLDDSYIEKKYELSTQLSSLPLEEQKIYQAKLNQIINTAYLNRFLKDRGKIVTGQHLEEAMLTFLDYKVRGDSPYQDKEAIYAVFKKLVQTQLKPEHFTESNSAFRQLLQDCALKARLGMLKMTDEAQIAKFKAGLSIVQKTAKSLKETTKEMSLTLPPSFPLESAPLGAKVIEDMYEQVKTQEFRKSLKNIFYPEIKDLLVNTSINAVSYAQQLKEQALSKEEVAKASLKEKCEKAKQNKSLNQHINLYTKWGSCLKAEMIQGFEDASEVLGDGVCFAICFRLLEEFQLKPDEEVERLSIHAIDRFRQALYMLKPSLHLARVKQVHKEEGKEVPPSLIAEFKKMAKEAPKEWLNGSPFQKDQTLFNVIYDPEEADLNKLLTSSKTMNKLKQSNGWMSVGMSMESAGHHILMRLDQERQRAWLFDPNIGFFCFEAKGKPFVQARDECLQCFKDIASQFYPKLYNLKINQLIPK